MNTDALVMLVLLASVLAANAPFLNNRWLLVLPRAQAKHVGIHAIELVLWYFVVGAVGLGLEQYSGQIYPQGWEFYATTASLFLTFAFPGFVYRYLFKRNG
jgi:hypothetical protein